MNNDDQYREGMKAYRKSPGEYSNPYPIGSQEYNQFERGWVQAQKRDNDHSSHGQYRSSYSRETSSKPSPSTEVTAELYTSRKG